MKEIGVTFFINNKDIPIKSSVKSKYDIDKNLIITFNIGTKGQDTVKLIFDKREYLDNKE